MAAKRDRAEGSAAAKHVTELNWKCSVFLEQLTAVFVSRATSLQLLELPTGPGPLNEQRTPRFAAKHDARRLIDTPHNGGRI
jgi:hypothetical protein